MEGNASVQEAQGGIGEVAADAHYLRLFGRPVINTGSEEYLLTAERRHQLLAYLACRGDWVHRSELAELFWGDHASEFARRNLRRLLHDIRRLPWVGGVEIKPDALRWRVASDLSDFMRSLERRDWRESIHVGSGVLLAGVERGATEAFHTWLRCERQAHLNRWRESVAKHREGIMHDPRARIDLGRRVLDHDPCNEATVVDLIEALHACGRESEALETYRQFAVRLKEELGVEPAVRADLDVPRDPAAVIPSIRSKSIRTHPGLIGRRLEQARLVEMLRRGECRRVTIHGPGGVGKSSLAASAPTLLRDDFPDGVRWVGLRDLANAAQIATRISEVCGFKGGLSHDPVASLGARIGAQHLLLVLDNCEHLAEVGAIGAMLVERCPNLKILHASRARVGGRGEWLLPLSGLAIPDVDERESDVMRNFDAIRLFESRAREVDPDFDVRRHIDDIAALVRMVEGLPLAIEIAAACMRLLPLGEIVRDMSHLLDLHESANRAPGHESSSERSLRASFEQSWRLLDAAEQGVLARLAVFNGSFGLAAATSLADAGLPRIGALADKSLVMPCGDGRFSLHPLIREFARERLDDERSERDRHAAYFAAILAARAEPATMDTVPWSDEDITHCLEAWRWGVSCGDVGLLQRMAAPLIRMFNRYLRWQEGIDTLEGALAALKGGMPIVEQLRAELFFGLGVCRFYNGEMEAAEIAARRSLRLCQALRIREQIPAADLFVIGASLAWRGEEARARRYFEQSLAFARLRGESESVAKALYGIALLGAVRGHWEEAREIYARGEALCRELGMHQWHALSLNGIGLTWLGQGHTREALDCFDQGIAICTAHDIHGRRSLLLANRAIALLQAGEVEEAARCVDRALREAQEWNVGTARVQAHLARCSIAMVRGDFALAREDLRSAMQVASSIESPLRRLTVVRHWGQWLVASGHRESGAAVLEFVRANRHSLQRDRDVAKAALTIDAAGVTQPPEARKRATTLEAIEAEILARS